MKLTYLASSEPGLAWMRAYYRQNPQLSRAKALQALQRAENDLKQFPFSGPKFGDMDRVREYQIKGTAFSLLYAVERDQIWIIDVRDGRGLRSSLAIRAAVRELNAM